MRFKSVFAFEGGSRAVGAGVFIYLYDANGIGLVKGVILLYKDNLSTRSFFVSICIRYAYAGEFLVDERKLKLRVDLEIETG